MISELSFARKFTAFWNQLLPGCESYVRLINQGLVERFGEPIDCDKRLNNRALVNTVAFALFKKIANNELKSDVLVGMDKTDSFKKIVKQEIDFLSKFSKQVDPQLPFQASEIKAIRIIATRLNDRFKKRKALVISPVFNGCGMLNVAEGDVWIDGTLVEVKSGERNFSVYDMRQLLIYCALNYQSNEKYIIDRLELFNPRVGISFSENLDEISMSMGSMSAEELSSEIINFVSENEFVAEI